MIAILIILGVAFGAGTPLFIYLKVNPQFGGKITKELLARFEKSPQWNGKIFENQSETLMDINLKTMPGLIKDQFSGRAARQPKQNIPILPLDTAKLNEVGQPKFVWFGHSALLLQMEGKKILIDPMLGTDASPVGPVRTKRFSEGSLEIIDQLPKLDVILLTHDHYDHLDMDSILKLKDKTQRWIVALGVARHLVRWGIDASLIEEVDWWDQKKLGNILITFTPSRHFSGRGLSDRAKSLWGGFVFKSPNHNIYWSGDGGYDDHFKAIGDKFGPFDIGFMECGQYNKLWHAIHMFPEECVQAGKDARANRLVPVHWGGFTLALHVWQDPIERFETACMTSKIDYITPEIGQVVALDESNTSQNWWKGYT
ncbi:MAG: L-ascorbate metabolism protein UlaG (beta-lactamase superfamily) [Marinoscillum sp.]|jgi:L-ascorbate metabolism protein UlaG (beta-lactamase superfamily)